VKVKVKVTSRVVLLAGLAATGMVLALGALGALDSAEWWTQDQRFLHARRGADPLGDRVCLVAIDDRALDTIGRWPWSRDTLALALDEVARAGARTVAIDILFTDSQAEAPDAALAAAIARVPTVAAVNMDQGRMDEALWRSEDGKAALQALVGAGAQDITVDPAALADRAGLSGERRARLLERPSQFKKLVAWRSVLGMRADGRPPADLRSFRLAMTAGDASLDQFPERLLLDEAFERDRAFASLAPCMAAERGDGSSMDAPPIPVIAAAARGGGFVNSIEDDDGHHRRVRPFWPTPYGALPQFGLAAGLLQLGIAPRDVRVEGGELAFPDGRTMPLERGMIRVDWPNAVFDKDPRGWRSGGDNGMIAIGALVDLSRQRVALARQEEQYRALGADIAGLQGLSADAVAKVPVDDATRAAIREQGEFVAGDLSARGTEDVKDLPPEERKLVGTYREWWRLDRELPAARARIADAERYVRERIEGRLVFVGFVATGTMTDMINTVFGARTPGVYFHATVADMVIGWHSVLCWPPWTAYPVGAAMGALCALVARKRGAGFSSAFCVLLASAWAFLAGGVAFVQADMMIPVAIPVICAVGAQAAGVSTAAVVSQQEKARVTRQFRARVSPQLVDRLASDPDALSMRGEQRESTILFGDLAGFTTISEKLGSEAVVATLNLYMSAMAKELTDRRAYVNKFLGDGLLAFWSAFGAEPEQGQLAAEAARACQRVVTEIGRRPDRQGLPKVSLRLGIATGTVTIGDCGAPPDLNDYTVIGDSANLAARLESANKQFGTAILFDGRTRELIRDAGGLPIVGLGRVVVVGQSHPIDAFTMLVEEPPAGWIESVGRAVEAFARADFAACAAAWDEHDARFGRSRLSAPFREAMEDEDDLRDGVLRLRAK
jgi:CHASE2 domain-containing sensor protein/class 3 adenylate cyclase